MQDMLEKLFGNYLWIILIWFCLTNLLSILLSSVHAKTWMTETFFKIINCLINSLRQFRCYLCVLYIFPERWRVFIFQSLKYKPLNLKSIEHFFSRFDRSSPSEVFLGKGALKVCSKFTEEQQCRSVSPTIEIAVQQGCSPVNLLHISEHLFLRTPLEGCFWSSPQ